MPRLGGGGGCLTQGGGACVEAYFGGVRQQETDNNENDINIATEKKPLREYVAVIIELTSLCSTVYPAGRARPAIPAYKTSQKKKNAMSSVPIT